MLNTELFCAALQQFHLDFFAGVPDSLLKNFCACLATTTDSSHYTITANEGAAVALAAGHFLAKRQPAVVFMQNSGLGNAVNPLLSLTDTAVYNIPLLLIIGWRGEPNTKDEPQHITQGELTLPLLQTMRIHHAVLADNDEEAAAQVKTAYEYMMKTNNAYALVVKKGTFSPFALAQEPNTFPLKREEALKIVIEHIGGTDCVVSTTGMLSRELFELREKSAQMSGKAEAREPVQTSGTNRPTETNQLTDSSHAHKTDFLTVGSMGHASHIALGIALNDKNRRVFCLDGDGAILMHTGSLAIIGAKKCKNFFHIVFNNGAHDSVGGQPTVALQADLPRIAKACLYAHVFSVQSAAELAECFKTLGAMQNTHTIQGAVFIEIKVQKGARSDLGRPTLSPQQNKAAFMDFIKNE